MHGRFCTGCPKSALERGEPILLIFFSWGHPQQKVLNVALIKEGPGDEGDR